MCEAALRLVNRLSLRLSGSLAQGTNKKPEQSSGFLLVEAAGVETKIGRFSKLLMARDF